VTIPEQTIPEQTTGEQGIPEQGLKFPFPDSHRLDVPPEFAELRAKCPVQRVGLPYGGEGWLVTRQAEVKTVLGDSRFSRAATVRADVPRTKEWLNPGGDILSLDPPEHSRMRKLVLGGVLAPERRAVAAPHRGARRRTRRRHAGGRFHRWTWSSRSRCRSRSP
jgi:cytochrome P450